jgi:uncharacterized membrane protein HdeD (DUF308 family)
MDQNKFHMHDGGMDFFGGMIEKANNWGWYLFGGIAMIALGVLTIGYSVMAGVISVALFGLIVLASGIAHLALSFRSGHWGLFFLGFLAGLAYIAAGLYLMSNPLAGMIALTMLFAVLLVVMGVFRMIISAVERFEYWGLMFAGGLLSLILGLMVMNSWPVSGLWVIGTFVGIEMIYSGFSWISISTVLHGIKEAGVRHRA